MFFRRYFAQEHEWDCSPVAIINALIWLKDQPSSNPEVREEAIITCGTDEDGTWDDDFVDALEVSIEDTGVECHINAFDASHFELMKKSNRFNAFIKKMIKQDNVAVILGHREIWLDDGEWHTSFWFKSFRILFWRFYVGINVKSGERYSIVSEKMFDRICMEGDSDGPVQAWVLQK